MGSKDGRVGFCWRYFLHTTICILQFQEFTINLGTPVHISSGAAALVQHKNIKNILCSSSYPIFTVYAILYVGLRSCFGQEGKIS